ncbi:MAG TPA: hypothetical protein VKU19_37730 [Bryobacteraceae bacterium]|nr:hypothetical protein [Bryobacteraceae bacterium]
MAGDLADALNLLAAALANVGIEYLIGGSVASSARGIARATRDVDVVANIGPQQIERFARELGHDWYVDSEQMRMAIRTGQSFNVILIPRSQKIDIFPATTEFHLAQLRRATKVRLSFLDIGAEYPVASAEDIILAKLQWYRMGGEVSDRQWNDITDLLAVNQDLDFEYIDSWAARLHVEDLLAKAVADANRE